MNVTLGPENSGCVDEHGHGSHTFISCIVHYTVNTLGAGNSSDDTPLSLACVSGQLDRVKYLVESSHCDPTSE